MIVTSRSRLSRTARAASVLFVMRMLVAVALVFPATATFSHLLRGFGGDAGLFAHGDLRALEVLDFFRASVRSMVVGGSIFLAFTSILELAPLAGVIASLAARPRPLGLGGFARAARRHFVGFTLLLGIVTLLEGITLALGSLGLRAIAVRALHGSQPTIDIGLALAQTCALVPVFVLGIAQDVARCTAVAHDVGFYDAVTRAFVVLRARPFALLVHYGVRLICGVCALGAGVAFTLSMGMAGTVSVGICAVVQLSILYWLAYLRASWLGRVLDLESTVATSRQS